MVMRQPSLHGRRADAHERGLQRKGQGVHLRWYASRFQPDKLAVRYEAILHIAVINDWLLTSL